MDIFFCFKYCSEGTKKLHNIKVRNLQIFGLTFLNMYEFLIGYKDNSIVSCSTRDILPRDLCNDFAQGTGQLKSYDKKCVKANRNDIFMKLESWIIMSEFRFSIIKFIRFEKATNFLCSSLII